MSDYEITTFADLCSKILDCNGEDIEHLVATTSPDAFSCTIRIEGDGYGGEIPGFLLQSLSEFQTQAFRAYAQAVYGKDDLRGVDKSKLWCAVQYRKGSLELVFGLAALGLGIGAAMMRDMSTTHRMILGMGVFAIFAGYIGADLYKTHSNEIVELEKQDTERQKLNIERQKVELETENRKDEQETIRLAMMLLSKQVSDKERETIVTSGSHGRVAVEAVIRDAKGAIRVTHGNNVIEQDEIKRIQSPESIPVKRYPLNGVYKIIQVNTENPELWKVLLKNLESSEKILAQATPSTLFLRGNRI